MRWPTFTAALFVASLFLASLASTSFGAITLNTIDRGWYQRSGLHQPDNSNYIAGQEGAANGWNNFFVFDLSTVSGSFTSAQLQLFLPALGYSSPDPSETYQFFDVSTPISTLVDGTGGVSAFNDLGSGETFGSVVIHSGDVGTTILVDLNPAGLTALNSSVGGLFAVGGAVTSLTGTDLQFVFGGTGGTGGNPTNGNTRIVLDSAVAAVPEPSTLVMFSLAGLGLACGALRRRFRKAA